MVGALIVEDEDEVLVVLESGKVVRSAVNEVPAKGRDTMGVVFARFEDTDKILAVARNSERNLETTDTHEGDDESADAVEVSDSAAPADASSAAEVVDEVEADD